MSNKNLQLDLTVDELVALYTMAKHGVPFVPRSAVRIAVDILDRLRPQLHAHNVPDDFINSMMS
jgi:hypothetical protein